MESLVVTVIGKDRPGLVELVSAVVEEYGGDWVESRMSRLAGEFAQWVDADPDWERMAPVPFATICFRYRPGGAESSPEEIDGLNQAILERINASGKIYLSATRLRDRFTLRVALGNPRATVEHVKECWRLLRAAANPLI